MTPRYPEVRSGSQKKPFWREYGEALFIALIMALVIRAFLVQAFSIPSGSMQPTLLIGDYLLVNKFSYGIRNPLTNKVWIPISNRQRGDVVVFIFPQDPSKDYIKRVIGLPGDTIEIREGQVYIKTKNSSEFRLLSEELPGVSETPECRNDGRWVIEKGQYFVLGDNRDESSDSSIWGTVPRKNFIGKTWLRYWPMSRFGLTPDYSYDLVDITGSASTGLGVLPLPEPFILSASTP